MTDSTDAMMRAMFGQYTVRVPAWCWIQDQGGGVISFVGASREGEVLRYGSNLTHQYILGELIVRPHFVVETDALRGSGLAGLATAGVNMDYLARNGRVICDPLGAFA